MASAAIRIAPFPVSFLSSPPHDPCPFRPPSGGVLARFVPAAAVLSSAVPAHAGRWRRYHRLALSQRWRRGASLMALAAGIYAVRARTRRSRAERHLSERAQALRADVQALRALAAGSARGFILWRDGGRWNPSAMPPGAFSDTADAHALAIGLVAWVGVEALPRWKAPSPRWCARARPSAF